MSTTVTGTTSVTNTSTAAAEMKKELGMNKDDFLKLFIAELQNQDPLSPSDTTEMLDQLAQLTQVEQAYNTSSALEKLLAAQDSSLAMTSVGLIGKEVKAYGSQIAFDGSSTASLEYQMPSAAASTTLKITNSAGQTVRTIDLGDVTSGEKSYQWDGKDGQGNQLSAGVYNFAVSGTTATGKTVAATTYSSGRVDGVTFENSAAYITIGSAKLPFTDVISVRAS